MRLDFTTTATCRPEILCKTYSNFRDNLLGVELSKCRLFINIDPVPDPTLSSECVRVAKSFFAEVFHNTPRRPSFSLAVRWCWLGPTTEFFFHLEDDWEMLRPFDLEEMIVKMRSKSKLSAINLRAYDLCDEEDSRISLCPGLFRTTHAKAMALRLDGRWNPEKQLRPIRDSNPHGGCHEGCLGLQIPRQVILRDIGREWLENSGWRKTRPITFNQWEPA